MAFIDVPSPASIGINPVTNRVYAASGSRIAVVDGYSRSVAFVEIGQTLSENIWVDTVHDRVFATGVGFVAILDGATNSVVKVEARNGAGVLEPYQASIVGHPGTGELYLIERLNKALMRLSIPEPANPVVSSIEVAQSVQDLAQSVPLLAGKPTVVRVYVSPGSYGSLTGVLTVTPDNGPAFDISSAATMASTTDALSDRRQDLAKSLNFVIANPPEGRIRVSLKTLSAGWSPWGQSMCTGACSRTVSLQPPLEMRLTVVGVSYQYGSFARKAPRDLDYNLLQSWLKRAYPISTLTFSKLQHDRPADAATSPTPAALFDCKWAADRAAEYRTRDIGRGTDKRTRYYALAFADVSSAPKLPALDVNGSFFAGGCSGKIPTSPDPSVTAAGWTGASTTLIPS
ncbi:MAG TPA: hypothetical protein VE443_08660, partial [Beijerinckiaceae bacterium]|nr:hypothetical protein [Beijerinckiaceae bacterium]